MLAFNNFAVGTLAATAAWLLALSRGVRALQTRGRPQIEPEITASLTDALTGLENADGFNRALTESLNNTTGCAVLLLDLDGFRSIRALHGRCTSDRLLHDFATRLASILPPGGQAARLRGDEFAVLMPIKNDAALRLAATCMLAQLKSVYYPEGKHCDVSLSIGAALLPASATTAEAALGAATMALESAKSAGGGVLRVFDEKLDATCRQRNALCIELGSAVAAGQFVPYYQPVVELATGLISSFEVLARWNHPEQGLLPPSEFIAIAEKQNLCGDLSVSLLRQVTRDQRDWPQHWRFAFNAAPGQLRELLDSVRDHSIVADDIISPDRLDLEITENALIGDLDLARAVVRAMHAQSTQVVLDDFGTGYANFLHLREIPFDRIKIDKSFVTNMLTDVRGEACVRAMLALAASLGVTVTAEGVETAEVAHRLRAMGCNQAQGYFYSQPLPASGIDVIAWALRTHTPTPTPGLVEAPARNLTHAGGDESPADIVACSSPPSAYLRPPCNTNIEAATTP